MIIHYFNGKGQMAYTLCWELPCGPLSVKHTVKHEKVTCPDCRRLMGWPEGKEWLDG